MNRIATMCLLGASGLAVAACGSATSAANNAGAKSSPSPGARQRNGAAGELVKISGTTLVLNSPSGDVNVTYTDSTTFQKTSTGAFADIRAGKCIVVTGPKDATGNLTPSGVVLSDPVNGACNARRGFGGPGGTPNPGVSPRPTPRPNNFGFVGGQVVAVSGTSVQVKDSTGAIQTVSVPTTVPVNKVATASSTDLALHECIQASGQRDSSGTVSARSINIAPAGPTGCFTGGRGFGGFGGRGAGGGGGGFGGGGGGFGGGAGGGPPAGD